MSFILTLIMWSVSASTTQEANGTDEPTTSPIIDAIYPLPSSSPTMIETTTNDTQIERYETPEEGFVNNETWIQYQLEMHCPGQEETARLCRDTHHRTKTRYCDWSFPGRCGYSITQGSTKFVNSGQCVTENVKMDVCLEKGYVAAVTFTGKACVGVDHGQRDCVTHGSQAQISEKMDFDIDPGSKLCLSNIGYNCGGDAVFASYAHVSTVSGAHTTCPEEEFIAHLPQCEFVLESQQAAGDCYWLPMGSDCFIIEDEYLTATLYCGGVCEDPDLKQVVDELLDFSVGAGNSIIKLLSLPMPWREKNVEDDTVNLDGCDFDAVVSLTYDSHPVEGWLDASGYSPQTNTYNLNQSVVYCIEQPYTDAPPNKTAMAVIMPISMVCLCCCIIIGVIAAIAHK